MTQFKLFQFFANPTDRYADGERVSVLIRWVTLIFFLFTNNVGVESTAPYLSLLPQTPIVVAGNLVIACVAFANLALHLALRRGFWPSKRFSQATTAADVLFVSAGIFLSEGLRSPYFILYFLLIFSSSIRFSLWESLGISVAVSLLYTLVVLAEPAGMAYLEQPLKHLLIRLFAFVSAGALSSYLAAREARRREYAEQQAANLAKEKANLDHALKELAAARDQALQANQVHRLLNEIGKALSATLDPGQLFEIIAAQIARGMYAANMWIAVYDPASEQVEFTYSRNPEEIVPGTRCPAEYGMTGYILKQRKSVLLKGDVTAQMAELGIQALGPKAAAWLGVPMKLGERVLGVIAVQHYTDPNAYGDMHRLLLESVASQAAIALENARLYQEVQSEKQYFESLVLNSPTAIVVIDLSANIMAWNPAAERLFGYTREEAVGRNIDVLVAQTAELRAEATAYSRQAAQGDILHHIIQRSRKDGSLVDIELFTVPVIVEKKQIGTLAIYHDITELQQARQAAEAATQAKSAFLATMSHEIRTPMNAVIGMTGLLLDTPLSPEQQEFVETIRTSGDALLTIINDILDFSKIEAGRMELENQPFELRECLESALDLVAPKAAEKGLNLAYVLAPQVPELINGDMPRLRQILVNLLGNAVKFTETGEVVLSVKAEGRRMKDEPAPDSLPLSAFILHFSVKDTGIGIPPDRMGRLFQSFSQVDASTTRRFGGTGLGLAISKRLVELMGGTMWAESEGTGKGSTFHFTVSAPGGGKLPRNGQTRGQEAKLKGKRALIVDDTPTNRRILCLQTQAWGIMPCDTGSAQEALDWIRRGDPFDIAFLDMQMPEMDGLKLASEIRRLRGPDQLPLVLLSSLGPYPANLPEVEIAAFLAKPLKASQIYSALFAIFGAEAPPAPPAASRPQFNSEMGHQHPLRILVAEDNTINQKLALRVLARLGYRADVAANGLEVLEALRRQAYDVVLMDVQMPEMDGLEATRAIRKEWSVDRRPRIIAMTANAMAEDRQECLVAGMDDFISKPIRVEELTSSLERCHPREGE